MKHGKRLTKKQKLFLESKGLDYRKYLSVKNTSEEKSFVHRGTGKTEQFKKEGDDYLHIPNGRSKANL